MPYVRFLDGLRCLSVAWVILHYLLIACYLLLAVGIEVFGVQGLLPAAREILHTWQWPATYTSNAYIALAKLVFTLLAYALTIAVASLSYRYFEAPLLKLKSRFATTPSAIPVSPAVAAPAAGSVQLAS